MGTVRSPSSDLLIPHHSCSSDIPRHIPNPEHCPVPQWRHLVISHLTTRAPAADAKELTPWAPPKPLKGTGPHRFVFLLFIGVDDVDIDDAREGWDVAKWARDRKMVLAAAGWFVVTG